MKATIPPAAGIAPDPQRLAGSDGPMTSGNHQSAREIYQRIAANIATIMQGQASSTRKLLAAFASGGHGLLEDFPRTRKKTPAKALARPIHAPLTPVHVSPRSLPPGTHRGL